MFEGKSGFHPGGNRKNSCWRDYDVMRVPNSAQKISLADYTSSVGMHYYVAALFLESAVMPGKSGKFRHPDEIKSSATTAFISFPLSQSTHVL